MYTIHISGGRPVENNEASEVSTVMYHSNFLKRCLLNATHELNVIICQSSTFVLIACHKRVIGNLFLPLAVISSITRAWCGLNYHEISFQVNNKESLIHHLRKGNWGPIVLLMISCWLGTDKEREIILRVGYITWLC